MEKRTPHHDLEEVKRLIRQGEVYYTQTARTGAFLLGMLEADMANVLLAMTRKDFYKSMTTYADHRCWQDVYRPKTEAGTVYLKLTVQNGVLIVSFKEK